MASKRVLLAPDKFRGTASAVTLIEHAAEAVTQLGWIAVPCAIADGGEGLLNVYGGVVRTTTVTGPLGDPVEASWRLIDEEGGGRTAVIEMARASGLALIGGPEGNNPLAATTAGTGELIRSAIEEGATTIIVGCGGSASTDGGLGAVGAIGELLPSPDITLRVASDVTTMFFDNARVFGPQKGATPTLVKVLSRRLRDLAQHYLDRYGVDVTTIIGAGAAGGLAGGLAALGGEVVSGFDLVAKHIGLDDLIGGVDLVVTGEGRVDRTSTSGKVVGELAHRCANRVPLLIVCGELADDVGATQLDGATIVSLTERFGSRASIDDAPSYFALVVGEAIGQRS